MTFVNVSACTLPLHPSSADSLLVHLQVQALEAALAKEHKQLSNSITAAATTAKKKLQDKFKAIEELNVKYQQVTVSVGASLPSSSMQ